MSEQSSSYDGIDDEATRRAARVLRSVETAMEGLGVGQRNYRRDDDDEVLYGRCNICFEGPMRSSQATFLNCGHVFHTACLRGWKTCVVCDVDIDEETLNTLNPPSPPLEDTDENGDDGESPPSPTPSILSYLSDDRISRHMHQRLRRQPTTTCALCECDGSETNLVSQTCGHSFHEECLQALRDEGRPCPKCNTYLNEHERQQDSSSTAAASSSASVFQPQNVSNQPSSSGLSESAVDLEDSSIETAIEMSLREENAPQQQSFSCPICMEDFSENTDRIALQCTHVFHASCIRTWMEQCTQDSGQTPHCPVCKHEIDEEFQQGIENYEGQSSNPNDDQGRGSNNDDLGRYLDTQYALDEQLARELALGDAISDDEEALPSSPAPVLTNLPGNTSGAQSSESVQDLASSHECPICMTESIGSESLALECSHVFHRECLKKWIEEHPSCPVCRNPINEAFLGAIRDLSATTVTTPANEETPVQIPQPEPNNTSNTSNPSNPSNPSSPVTDLLRQARIRRAQGRLRGGNNCVVC